MADNVAITAGAGTSIATDDVGGVQYQRVKPAFGADGAAADVSATNPLPTKPYKIAAPSDATFTRPADTTAYAVGDLVANSTTAGSVAPMSFTGATLSGSGGSGTITGLIATKSAATAALLRYHFLKTSHAVTSGDNGALVFTSLDPDNYLGRMDVSFTGTDDDIGASGALVGQSYDPPIDYVLSSGDTIYVFVQALTAYTPGNAEIYGCRPTFRPLS